MGSTKIALSELRRKDGSCREEAEVKGSLWEEIIMTSVDVG